MTPMMRARRRGFSEGDASKAGTRTANVSRETLVNGLVLLFLYFSCYCGVPGLLLRISGFGANA
jgi:hypothetical protein